MNPAALLAGLAVDLAERCPETERPVAHGQLRRNRQPPTFEIQEQFKPGLCALPVAVAQAYDILVADLVGADDHQQALPVMIEAGLEVDAVGPEIDIAPGREIPPLPPLVIFRPGGLQPGDGGRRQARGVRTQQSRERLREIARRDALEVEPGQQLLERPGAPEIGRQDRRGEADGAAGHGLAIANPRPAHRDRADPGLHLPLRQITVPDNTPVPRAVDKIRVFGNEGGDLRLDRLGQKAPRTSPQHLRQRVLNRNPVWMRKRNNRIFVHGVSFPRGKWRLRPSPGYAALTSRHHQDSVIAPKAIA